MKKNARNAQQEMSILLIDEDTDRANVFTSALDKSRYKIRHIASPTASLLKEVDTFQPDIIVIDIESPNRDMLECLHTIADFNPKPVVMFSEQEDPELISLSVKSGVSAYVVGDADTTRVKSILDVAVARFYEYQKLKDELTETKQKLESRKIIDQAKHLLMEKRSMSEKEAFHAMRKMAMDAGQKLDDVAQTLITILNTFDMKGKGT